MEKKEGMRMSEHHEKMSHTAASNMASCSQQVDAKQTAGRGWGVGAEKEGAHNQYKAKSPKCDPSLTLYQDLALTSSDCDTVLKPDVLHSYTKKFSKHMLVCGACDFTRLSKRKTEHHMATVHTDKTLQIKKKTQVFWSCNICSKIFLTSEILRLHFISQHVMNNTSLCYTHTDAITLADINRDCKVALVINKQGGSVGKLVSKFSCSQCTRTFLSQNNLNNHLLCHWPQEKCPGVSETKFKSHLYWICDICDQSKMNLLVSFRDHFAEAHSVNVGLEMSENSMIVTSTGANSVIKFLCTVCKVSFEDLQGCKDHAMHDHKWLIEGTSRKFNALVCLKCNKNCNEPVNLDFCCKCVHIKTQKNCTGSTSQNPIAKKSNTPDSDSQKSITTISKLQSQGEKSTLKKLLASNKIKLFRFECDYCKEHFLTPVEYEVHMTATHTDEVKKQPKRIAAVTCVKCRLVLITNNEIEPHINSCYYSKCSKSVKELNKAPHIKYSKVKLGSFLFTKIVISRFRCMHCNKYFWDENNCKSHMNKVHCNEKWTLQNLAKGSFTLYYCKLCSVFLNNINYVRKHHLNHVKKMKTGAADSQDICVEQEKLNSFLCSKMMVFEDGCVVLNKSLFGAKISNVGDTVEGQAYDTSVANISDSISQQLNADNIVASTSNKNIDYERKSSHLESEAMKGNNVKSLRQTSANIVEVPSNCNDSSYLCVAQGESNKTINKSLKKSAVIDLANLALKDQPAVIEVSDCEVQESHQVTPASDTSKFTLGCRTCSLVFPTLLASRMHMQRIHSNELTLSYMLETTFDAMQKEQQLVHLNLLHSWKLLSDNERLVMSNFDRFEEVLYICCCCSEEFGTRIIFMDHMAGVHSQGETVSFKCIQQFKSLFRCKECKFKSESLSECIEHHSSCAPQQHPPDSITFDSCLVKCSCKSMQLNKYAISDNDKQSCDKESCKKHLKILTLYQCSKCSSVFNLHYLLKSHASKICKQSTNVSSKLASQEDMLKNYMKLSTIYRPVDVKDFRVSSMKDLNISGYERKSLLAFPCSLCPQIFLTREKFLPHMTLLHSEHKQALIIKKQCQAFICKACKLVLFAPQECKEHLKTCGRSKRGTCKLYCSSCKLELYNWDMYITHVHSKHCQQIFSIPENSIVTYACFHCLQMFSTFIKMEIHSKRCGKQNEKKNNMTVIRKSAAVFNMPVVDLSDESKPHDAQDIVIIGINEAKIACWICQAKFLLEDECRMHIACKHNLVVSDTEVSAHQKSQLVLGEVSSFYKEKTVSKDLHLIHDEELNPVSETLTLKPQLLQSEEPHAMEFNNSERDPGVSKAVVNSRTSKSVSKVIEMKSGNKAKVKRDKVVIHRNTCALICNQCNAGFKSQILLINHFQSCNKLDNQASCTQYITHPNIKNCQQEVLPNFNTHQPPHSMNSLGLLQEVVLSVGKQNLSQFEPTIICSNNEVQIRSVTSRACTTCANTEIEKESDISDGTVTVPQTPHTVDIGLIEERKRKIVVTTNLPPAKKKRIKVQCKNCDLSHFPDSLNPNSEFSLTFKSSYTKMQRAVYKCMTCHKIYFTLKMYLKHVNTYCISQELFVNPNNKMCEIFKCLVCVNASKYFFCFGALADHFQTCHNFVVDSTSTGSDPFHLKIKEEGDAEGLSEKTDDIVKVSSVNNQLTAANCFSAIEEFRRASDTEFLHHEIDIKEEQAVELDADNVYTVSSETLERTSSASNQYLHHKDGCKQSNLLPDIDNMQGHPTTSCIAVMDTDMKSELNAESSELNPQLMDDLQTVQVEPAGVKYKFKDKKLKMWPVVMLHRLENI